MVINLLLINIKYLDSHDNTTKDKLKTTLNKLNELLQIKILNQLMYSIFLIVQIMPKIILLKEVLSHNK